LPFLPLNKCALCVQPLLIPSTRERIVDVILELAILKLIFIFRILPRISEFFFILVRIRILK